jgi:hypothetical protein
MVLSEAAEQNFAGTKSEQDLASDLLKLLQARGRFMAINSAIRVSTDLALQYLKDSHKRATVEMIEKVAELNPGIFELEDVDGTKTVSTTRAGRIATTQFVDRRHTFSARMMEPEPKPEGAEIAPRPRPRMDSSWSIYDRILTDYELAQQPSGARPFVPTEPEGLGREELDSRPAASPAIPALSLPPTAPLSASVEAVSDHELDEALVDQFGSNPQVAYFGGRWMLEDRVPRFSKGELRKIKDYIAEQEQPLTDEVLVQDVLDVRPRAADFELTRFALNYRLSREHRDFDFVGTANQRFWSTAGLPPIGTTRRKATEIATDYRFLVEDVAGPPRFRSLKEVSHVLSFYEFTLGLLPYDADIQSLMPKPVLANQRTAVITFECPQVYTTYLVELRYPTPNRGGFLVGLDDFYSENLVPGALISIKATENDGHYIVEYIQASNQSQRLLEFDVRRQRYVFRPTSFSCGVIDDQLLTEDKWSALNGERPLDDKIRRRPESVVAATFERLGHPLEGNGFSAAFAELYAGVNIERPISESQLRSILANDDSGAFAKDPDGPDVYTYIPGSSS